MEGNELPYLPSALARRRENFNNRTTEDPEAKCHMVGVPRIMYMPYPVQIFQTPQQVTIKGFGTFWAVRPTVAHIDIPVTPLAARAFMQSAHSIAKLVRHCVVDEEGTPLLDDDAAKRFVETAPTAVALRLVTKLLDLD